MADATLSTEFSRRAMLGGAAAVSTVATMAGVAAVPAVAAPWRGPLTRASQRSAASQSSTLPSPGAAPTLLPPPPLAAPGDARLTLLAGEYRRVLAALHDWIDLAEAGGGICACTSPPWQGRHDALAARADGLVAEIASIHPDSVFGLAAKLRAGVYYDYAEEVPLEFDQRLLGPVLDDLDRMAEAALFDGL